MSTTLAGGISAIEARDAGLVTEGAGAVLEHGGLLLRGVWSTPEAASWSSLGPEQTPAASGLWGSKPVYALLLKVLGADFVLAHVTRDGETRGRRERSLFDDRSFDVLMPAIGLRVLVPTTTHATLTLWPKSHQLVSEEQARALPSSTLRVDVGDALCLDTRLLWELQGPSRQLLCLSYYRKWFRDWEPCAQDAAAITRTAWQGLPAELRHLFGWRFDPYVKWRQRHLVETAISYLPSRLRAPARRAILKA